MKQHGALHFNAKAILGAGNARTCVEEASFTGQQHSTNPGKLQKSEKQKVCLNIEGPPGVLKNSKAEAGLLPVCHLT